MVISIRMNDDEKRLADAYAKINGVSLSEAIKKAYFEKIEGEYDLALVDTALKEYKKPTLWLSLKRSYVFNVPC